MDEANKEFKSKTFEVLFIKKHYTLFLLDGFYDLLGVEL